MKKIIWWSLAAVAAFGATGITTMTEAASAVVAPSDWSSLGGSLTSDPAVVAIDDTHALHFARGSDGALWRYSDGVDDGINVEGWASLGGVIVGGPAVVRTSAGDVEVFAHGLDHGLWHRTLGVSGWSEWESLGGILTSDPAAWNRSGITSAEDLRVFVRGSDGSIWHRGQVGGAWQAWSSLGGTAIGSPAAAHGLVAVRGADDRVWTSTANPSGFSTWSPIPNGVVSSDPAITAAGDLMVWVRGLDGALWHMRYDRFASPWPGNPGPSNTYQWRSLGGQLVGGPGASCIPTTVSPANQAAVVDIRGIDNALWTIHGGTSAYYLPECT